MIPSTSSFRIVAILDKDRRILVIDPLNNQEIKPIIRRLYNLQDDFDVVMKFLNAKVTYTDELFPNDEIEIQTFQRVQNDDNIQQMEEEKVVSIKVKTDTQDLKGKKFGEKTLKEEIKEWAAGFNFSICFINGETKLEEGVRRTIACSKPGCPFKLYFLAKYSKLPGEDKPDLNSYPYYEFDFAKDEHDHLLKEISKSFFTKEITEEINKMKGKMKTIKILQDHINSKFKCGFSYSQIVHKVNQLHEENFGKPHEDASLLIRELEKEAQLNQCKYEVDYMTAPGPERVLRRILYVSSTMQEYAKKFLDIVIVDATYKRNRFNMPLVNVIGVNNHGRSILLAFALLDNEKQDSYNWIFSKLKGIWKSDPGYWISDEYNEIISGNFIVKLINFLGIKTIFPKSGRLICSWHLQRHFVSRFSSLISKDKSLYDKTINLPFITRLEKFNDVIKELKKPGVLNQSQLEYLNKKLGVKETWAKCIIKKDFVGGICTTSRVESLHSILKDDLNSNSSLQDVLQAFKKIEKSQINKFQEEYLRHTKNIKGKLTEGFVMAEIKKKYTDYAIKKLEQRINKTISYKVEEIKKNSKW